MSVPDQTEEFASGGSVVAVGVADEQIMGFGVCTGGTDNTTYWFTSPEVARATLLSGSGLEWVLVMLAGGRGKRVGFTKVEASVDGEHSAVVKTGTGGVVTLTGDPDDDEIGEILITKEGNRGVGRFKYTLDGRKWSRELVIAATFDTGFGTVFNFPAATYEKDTTYTWTGTGPGYTLDELSAAYDVADIDGRDWEMGFPIGHVPFDTDDETTADNHLALVTGMAAKTTASEANHRFRVLIFEGPEVGDDADGDTALNDSFSDFADERSVSAAHFVKVTSPRTGRRIRRSVAWAAAYRARQRPVQRDLAAVADKTLPSALFSMEGEHDESGRQGLDRFLTLRTFVGKTPSGPYITNAPLLSAEDSRYRWLQHRRIMDQIARFTRQLGLDKLSAELRTYSGETGEPAAEDPSRTAGTILEEDAIAIENDWNAQLFGAFTLQRRVQWVLIEIDRDALIETTEDLRYGTNAKAFLYPKHLTNVLSLAP